jgi:hypothetical protein
MPFRCLLPQEVCPTGFETLLITAKCSGRVAEATCDIVLIRVSRLEKLNHGVGFGRTILNRVMGEDDAMDEEHSLALLGLNANAIVNEDGTGDRGKVGKKLLLRCGRAHVFLACSISTDSKSGQFRVRTPLKEKPSQLRLPGMRRRGVEHFQSRNVSSQNRMISICRFRKSGQFRVRTSVKEKPSQLRLPGMRRRGVERFQSRKCSSQNRMISICRFRKSGQFKVRTPLSKNPNSGRFLGVCQEL